MTSLRKTATLAYKEVLIDVSEDDDLSSAGNLGPAALCGLVIPAGMTSTSITFQASVDGTTFYDVYDSTNTQISVTIDSSAKIIKLDPADFVGLEYLKLVTGSAEGADRTIGLIGVKAGND